jgi:hypothetical protein
MVIGAGIAEWYSAGLRAEWSGLRVPEGAAGNFSLRHRVQTGSGAHPASYPMATRGSFSGGKAAGAWNHSPPSLAEVKIAWSYTSIHTVCLMAWCSVKAQGQFYLFTFIIMVIKSRRMRSAGRITRLGEKRSVYKISVRKPVGKRPLERTRLRWESVTCEAVDWVQVTQDGVHWLAVVNIVCLVHLFVPWMAGYSLTS